MCGIPYFSKDVYIKKLLLAGERVAVCEQIPNNENEKKSVKLLDRKVNRVYTPGTLLEDNLLTNNNNFLLQITSLDSDFCITWCDISTGEYTYYSTTDINQLYSYISYINPKEILIQEELIDSFKNVINDSMIVKYPLERNVDQV